ncbi:hypothetical protein B0J13DRAFT_514551 [Dactylonectria estremocensis]|uniref:Uncharacterized protein n=1 Tax=Dactylonectria estremocensis TaxID=1079267 RepID=A0A9P9IDR3_9HYPO|nr:hypothetical protein B0J13DRAFT_514551 [Dactylonectria estremocensis]
MRCGKARHDSGDCTVPEQCANCLGPHSANFAKCPAGPKKVHGVFRRLTKEQRDDVRVVGAETHRQRNVEAQRHALDPQQDSAGPQERSSPRAPQSGRVESAPKNHGQQQQTPAASRRPIPHTTPTLQSKPEVPTSSQLSTSTDY